MKKGDKVMMEGVVREVVDMGGGRRNICLSVIQDNNEEVVIWLTEGQIAAMNGKVSRK